MNYSSFHLKRVGTFKLFLISVPLILPMVELEAKFMVEIVIIPGNGVSKNSNNGSLGLLSYEARISTQCHVACYVTTLFCTMVLGGKSLCHFLGNLTDVAQLDPVFT